MFICLGELSQFLQEMLNKASNMNAAAKEGIKFKT